MKTQSLLHVTEDKLYEIIKKYLYIYKTRVLTVKFYKYTNTRKIKAQIYMCTYFVLVTILVLYFYIRFYAY